MTQPDIPRLSWPLCLDGSTLAVVEQDSLDEIAECVALVCSTQLGSRMELPSYGINNPAGSRDLNEPEVLTAIAECEPRAVVAGDSVQIVDGLGTLVLELSQ